jgi:hypothetical protein
MAACVCLRNSVRTRRRRVSMAPHPVALTSDSTSPRSRGEGGRWGVRHRPRGAVGVRLRGSNSPSRRPCRGSSGWTHRGEARDAEDPISLFCLRALRRLALGDFGLGLPLVTGRCVSPRRPSPLSSSWDEGSRRRSLGGVIAQLANMQWRPDRITRRATPASLPGAGSRNPPAGADPAGLGCCPFRPPEGDPTITTPRERAPRGRDTARLER